MHSTFKFFLIFLFILIIVCNAQNTSTKKSIISSIFGFGRKTPGTTVQPVKAASSNGRCSATTRQCSAYECCNSNQTCLKNRCFPRLSNCPVTRDQCGTSCCRTSEICRNGNCT